MPSKPSTAQATTQNSTLSLEKSPQMVGTITTALCCPSEPAISIVDDITGFDCGNGEIKLEPSLKLPPCRPSYVVLEGGMKAIGLEKSSTVLLFYKPLNLQCQT